MSGFSFSLSLSLSVESFFLDAFDAFNVVCTLAFDKFCFLMNEETLMPPSLVFHVSLSLSLPLNIPLFFIIG